MIRGETYYIPHQYNPKPPTYFGVIIYLLAHTFICTKGFEHQENMIV